MLVSFFRSTDVVRRVQCSQFSWVTTLVTKEYSEPSLKNTSKKGIEEKNFNKIGGPDIDFPDSLELSFEYLMNRNEMRWIKVISHQAVLISLCLQGMVQQLLGTKEMSTPKSPSERIRKGSLSYMKRDGSSTKIILNHTGEPLDYDGIYASPIGELSWRRLSERLSEFSFLENHRQPASDVNGHQDSNFVENNAFNVIGDENL